jgi:hypothetical protein
MPSYAPGDDKSSMGNHRFQFILCNRGHTVAAIYKGKACLLVICVLLIGCLNDKQSGSDNFTEFTATISYPQTPIATSIQRTMTPTPTATKSPTTTTDLLPTLISTPQASPVPTPTPLPPLVWAEGVEQVANIQGIDHYSVLWSPIANEFIANDCWFALHNEVGQQSIFHIAAPDFLPVNITPASFVCEPEQDMIWSVDAAHILFAGPFPEDHPLHPSNYGWDNSAIWIMDRHGNDSYPLNLDQAYGRYVDFIAWMDDQTLVYKSYAGGGHHYTAMLNVGSGEPISWAGVQIGGGYQPGLNYIGTNTGMTSGGNTGAVAVSQTMVYSDTVFDGGPFMLCVSKFFCNANPPDKPPLLDSNSRFEDWLPGTNKMLLLTWEAAIYLTDFDVETLESRLNRQVETQLQLWDVDVHEVSMLISQGIYGRFSADGQYLAFHTFTAASTNDKYDTQLHVLRMADEQIILSLPSAEPVIDYDVPVFVWSPRSDRLLYRDEQDNWQIIQIPNGNRTPITLNGGARLSFPQWSSDSRYLSVIFRDETEGGTVILWAP